MGKIIPQYPTPTDVVVEKWLEGRSFTARDLQGYTIKRRHDEPTTIELTLFYDERTAAEVTDDGVPA